MTESQHLSPDYAALVAASAVLADGYAIGENDPWETSPFGWIVNLRSSRTKGAVGEKLVAEWAVGEGFEVRRATNSHADRIINGHRIEVKMSTLWETGTFRFQQIRDQDYDYCLCLGLMPQDARAWLLPKELLRQHVIGHTGQHGGAKASETAWIAFPADQPHEWMEGYGGTLADVANAVRALGRGPY